MPRSPIDEQDDLLAGPELVGAPEVIEDELHSGRVDLRQESPVRLPVARLNKPVHVTPLLAVGTDCQRALPPACPDPPDNRLEPPPGLVMRPHFDLGPRLERPQGHYLAAEFFLNALCCSRLAACPCRRRGCCGVSPSRRK
jgi:hypothetical protein